MRIAVSSSPAMHPVICAITAGADFDDVVMLSTFHVWQGPNFEGDRPTQFAAFSAVKDEFMKAPYPAWTAVGTTALIPDTGIVEIQAIVHLKK